MKKKQKTSLGRYLSLKKLKESILHVIGDFHTNGGIDIRNIEKELIRYLPNKYNPKKYYIPGRYNVKSFGFRSIKELLMNMYDDVFIKNIHTAYARAFLTFKHIYCLEEEDYSICENSYCKYKHTNKKSYAHKDFKR